MNVALAVIWSMLLLGGANEIIKAAIRKFPIAHSLIYGVTSLCSRNQCQ